MKGSKNKVFVAYTEQDSGGITILAEARNMSDLLEMIDSGKIGDISDESQIKIAKYTK